MGLSQTFGRLLFVIFLVVRGVQHVQKPTDWGTKFAAKYQEHFNFLSNNPLISQNVPAHLFNLLHPRHISVFATEYGQYIGFTELLLALCIILEIPLLPIIVGTFLLFESLIFFNPLNPKIGPEIYYLIVNVGLVGIVYMMAFAPPIFKVLKRVEERKPAPKDQKQTVQAAPAGKSSSGSTSKKPGK